MLILYVDLDDNRAAIARIAGAVVVGTDDQAIASVSVIISDLASKPAQSALVIAAVPRNPNSARGLSIKQMAEAYKASKLQGLNDADLFEMRISSVQ